MSAPETHSVKRHLDVVAEDYDAQIRRFIPHYDEMIATGVQVLAALAPADGHVLDLGGGTGAFCAAVLDGLPGVRVTVLDVDADMLAEARRRLAGVADRVSFQEGSFLDPLLPADAVVASLALHHVHDLQTKDDPVPRDLCCAVARWRAVSCCWSRASRLSEAASDSYIPLTKSRVGPSSSISGGASRTLDRIGGAINPARGPSFRFDRAAALTPGCCYLREQRGSRPIERAPASDPC